MTVTDLDDQFATAVAAAAFPARHYHTCMGDPMYALSSSGTVMLYGRYSLDCALEDDAQVGERTGHPEDAEVFRALAELLEPLADHIAEADEVTDAVELARRWLLDHNVNATVSRSGDYVAIKPKGL